MTSPAAPVDVLLLDLYPHRDGFFGDDRPVEVTARLRERGLAVHLLRATEVSAQDARVAAAPTAPVVVLMRAWSEQLVDGVRAQLRPGARLVRLSRDGTPS